MKQGRDELTQLKVDILWLAQRQKVMEDAVIQIEDALLEFNKAISEWSESLTKEMLKQGVTIHKNKRSFEYFKSTLSETHKQYYEKFESLFSTIHTYLDKKKQRSYK